MHMRECVFVLCVSEKCVKLFISHRFIFRIENWIENWIELLISFLLIQRRNKKKTARFFAFCTSYRLPRPRCKIFKKFILQIINTEHWWENFSKAVIQIFWFWYFKGSIFSLHMIADAKMCFFFDSTDQTL